MYFQDIQKFLDEAKDGVIYFSLGTNVFNDLIPEEKIRVFVEAFSELPQRILWKLESDILPGQPPNVKFGKWLPQQDILGNMSFLWEKVCLYKADKCTFYIKDSIDNNEVFIFII
jgi:UDP:flavonoid glycosyltransferase YjiC (YdhE family)